MFLGRAPGAGEPLWLDDDRQWALALMAAEEGTCGGCGQPKAESMHPAAETGYTAGLIRCHGCTAAAREARRFAKTGGDPAGLMIHVTRRGETPGG